MFIEKIIVFLKISRCTKKYKILHQKITGLVLVYVIINYVYVPFTFFLTRIVTNS